MPASFLICIFSISVKLTLGCNAYGCLQLHPCRAELRFSPFYPFPCFAQLRRHTRERLSGNLKCDASRESMMLSSPLKRIVEEATIQCTSTIYSIRGTRLLESWHTVSFQLYGLQMTNCEFSPFSKLSLTPRGD